jgi:hemoglobin
MRMSDERIPTLAEWAGGTPAFERLTDLFYGKVTTDPLLGPVFAGMRPEHSRRVAAFIVEVFGGEKGYSKEYGDHAGMIRHHMHRHLTEPMRRRWMELAVDAADEAGLPLDPEFRSAFVGYLEWGTRLAVMNSQPDATPPGDSLPMPRWGWGPPGGPYRG